MKNSIEQIWQQGFINETASAIPTINNLYNKKAQNIVDKIHRMYVLNVKFLYGFSAFSFIGCVVYGWLLLAVVMPCLLLWIAVVGQKQLKKLDLSNKSDTSYQYIKSCNLWFKDMVSTFSFVYQFFYPVFALAIMLQIRLSPLGEKITQAYLYNYPDSSLLFGTPWLFYLAAGLITAVIAYFSVTFFLFDLKLMYGRVIKKLDDILFDMEELRQ